ncbi:hypothetical protein PLESTB_000595300 [Pleodorina starrii]|uniref:Uncharacterized protein n=1 Tax=Pleodorina starrii TaxID=330485 RepID=A0A9W6BHB5_9CHLO|nr:hypothetical protein PLESTB_000595300 [Pleodorina starrii]
MLEDRYKTRIPPQDLVQTFMGGILSDELRKDVGTAFTEEKGHLGMPPEEMLKALGRAVDKAQKLHSLQVSLFVHQEPSAQLQSKDGRACTSTTAEPQGAASQRSEKPKQRKPPQQPQQQQPPPQQPSPPPQQPVSPSPQPAVQGKAADSAWCAVTTARRLTTTSTPALITMQPATITDARSATAGRTTTRASVGGQDERRVEVAARGRQRCHGTRRRAATRRKADTEDTVEAAAWAWAVVTVEDRVADMGAAGPGADTWVAMVRATDTAVAVTVAGVPGQQPAPSGQAAQRRVTFTDQQEQAPYHATYSVEYE